MENPVTRSHRIYETSLALLIDAGQFDLPCAFPIFSRVYMHLYDIEAETIHKWLENGTSAAFLYANEPDDTLPIGDTEVLERMVEAGILVEFTSLINAHIVTIKPREIVDNALYVNEHLHHLLTADYDLT